MKRIYFFISCLLFTLQINAQEHWGAANSNYAGVMGHDLNPASIVGTPFKWELNFLAADVSLMNNYVYLQRNSGAVRAGMKGEGVSADRIQVNNSKRDKSAFASVNLKLPSFMISRAKYGLGFHVATRMALSVNGVPGPFATFMKEGFTYTPLQKMDLSIDNMKLAAMNWNEAGITAGVRLFDITTATMTAGITANYLYGMNSFYLDVNKLDYNVQSDSLWHIGLANAEYGHSLSADPNDLTKQKGSGFSTSLGVQYYRGRNETAYDNCAKDKSMKKYDYKIGISLIDIGFINYNKNTLKFKISNISTDWYGIDTVKLSSASNADSVFNSQFFGSPTGGISGESYNLWLPAAASFQFDLACSPTIYINFSAIQRLPVGAHELKRPNQLSITPRFELKRLEVSIPYSYYDYFRHRIGLSLRLGALTIGSDMIGPFTGKFDAYGLNFYMGLRWQHFESCFKKHAKKPKEVKTADNKGKDVKTSCFTDFK